MRMTKYLYMGILLMAGPVFSQEVAKEADPFAGKAALEKFEGSPSWDVTCEVFSLPLSEAAKLKRLRKSDAEDYAELVQRVESGKAKQEEFLMLRTTEGAGTTVEEISEMIYATEYEPPELPNEIGNLGEDIEKAKMLVTPATPSAFDTKNVGSTLEVALTAGDDEKVEVRLAMNLVSYLGRQVWGQGLAESEMPRFALQNVKTGLEVTPDSPSLIGSISPPEALQPEEGERQVWLAFVTVSKSKE